MRKIHFNWSIENKVKGKYKIFNLLPGLCFIVDRQFTEGLKCVECEDKEGFCKQCLVGCVEYSIFFEFLFFQIGLYMQVDKPITR